MTYTDLKSFSSSQKGKYVRFKSHHYAENISHHFTDKTQPAGLKIAEGAIGIIYEVRGESMFIGFSKDLKIPPRKNLPSTSFAVTIKLGINNINKIQIES